MTEASRTFPTMVDLSGHEVILRLMTADDAERLAAWAGALPEDDLLFMRRDITRREEIDDWVHDIERGHVKTVLAEVEGQLAGYATMHRSPLRWSAHVAELRVVVSPEHRGIGLGRALTQEAFQLALEEGVEKMVAQMTLDQAGARRSFEEFGFRPEALLREHVKDRHGKLCDLLVMSHAVADYHQMLATYAARR